MPDIREIFSRAWDRAIDQMFAMSPEEIIIMWLAVALAVIAIILLIRWVD